MGMDGLSRDGANWRKSLRWTEQYFGMVRSIICWTDSDVCYFGHEYGWNELE